MAIAFDSETIDLLRSMKARRAFETAKSAVYEAGETGSEDFQEIYAQLVSEGILTWDQIRDFER